jgi:acyl CoA:acetate/3-ketoacid CoA transferase alpha subunit
VRHSRNLIEAIRDSGVKEPDRHLQQCGVDDFGLGVLLDTGRSRR